MIVHSWYIKWFPIDAEQFLTYCYALIISWLEYQVISLIISLNKTELL